MEMKIFMMKWLRKTEELFTLNNLLKEQLLASFLKRNNLELFKISLKLIILLKITKMSIWNNTQENYSNNQLIENYYRQI